MSPSIPRLAELAERATFSSDPDAAGRLAESALRRLAYRRAHGGKACSACRRTRPVSAFGNDHSRPDGLLHRCRDCDNARKRAGRR